MNAIHTDRAAVSLAWETHQRELSRFLQRQGLNAEDAEELVQEAFVRALRGDVGFRNIHNPRAWLFRVAKNLLVDRYRWSKPEISVDSFVELMGETPDASPVDSLSRCLPRVLAVLPREDRDVLVHCDLLGVTQVEFAETLQISLPATKSRIQRARKRLRERLISVCQIRFDAAGQICCFVPLG